MSEAINGIDVAALRDTIETIRQDPTKGHVSFHVTTRWTGQTSSESRPTKLVLDGEVHDRISRSWPTSRRPCWGRTRASIRRRS